MVEDGVGECGVVTGAGRAGGVAVPEDHCCSRCGYPSGRSGSVVCPECGWEATAQDIDMRAHRLGTITAWELGVRWYGWWLAASAVYALGAMVVVQSLQAGIAAVLVVGLAIPLSAALGRIPLRRHDDERRRYLLVVWEQTLWILHLPWLVAPVFLAVALFVGLIDRWANGWRGGVYQTIVKLVFFGWFVGCVVVFVVWWQRRIRALALGGYRRLDWADGWAFLAGVVVIVGAGFMGFVAWMATAIGVADWLGLAGF